MIYLNSIAFYPIVKLILSTFLFSFRFKVIVCGSIAMIATALIIRKIYLRKKRERNRRKSSSQPKNINDDEDVVVVFKVQKR